MPQRLPWEDWREGDDEMTSGWMRATSPGGSAAYENTVAWSGELGYGVRAPELGQADAPIEAAAVEISHDDPHDHEHDGHDEPHDHDHEQHGDEGNSH